MASLGPRRAVRNYAGDRREGGSATLEELCDHRIRAGQGKPFAGDVGWMGGRACRSCLCEFNANDEQVLTDARMIEMAMPDLRYLFQNCPNCGKRLPPITGCTAGLIARVRAPLADHGTDAAIEALLRETDWNRDLARGYLTCPHFVPISAAQCTFLRECEEATALDDPDLVHVLDCWVALDLERFTPNPGESLSARLAQEPWQSNDPRIRSAWDALTDPKNMSGLEKWKAMDVLPCGGFQLSARAVAVAGSRMG